METAAVRRPSPSNRQLNGSFFIGKFPGGTQKSEISLPSVSNSSQKSLSDDFHFNSIGADNYDCCVSNQLEIDQINERKVVDLDEVDFARTASLMLKDSAIIAQLMDLIRNSDTATKDEFAQHRHIEELKRCRKRFEKTSHKMAIPSKSKRNRICTGITEARHESPTRKRTEKLTNSHLPQLQLVFNQLSNNPSFSPQSASCSADINTLASLDLNDWLALSSNETKDFHLPNIDNKNNKSRPVSPIQRLSTPQLPSLRPSSSGSLSPLRELNMLHEALHDIRMRESKTADTEDDDNLSVDSLVELLRCASRAGTHAATLAILLNT